MNVSYHKTFLKEFKKFDISLQDEIIKKIELFKKDYTDKRLKTHKLGGKLKKQMAFSVNYSLRIFFEIINDEAVLLDIGGHDLYR